MPITRPDGCEWPNGVDPSDCTVQNLRAIVSDNNDRNENRDVSNCSLPSGALDERDFINENTCSFNPCCASMFTNFWDECKTRIPLSPIISQKYNLMSNACKRLPAPAGNCEDEITSLPETCSVANLGEIMSQYCPSENNNNPPNLCQDQCCREVFTNYVNRCRRPINRELAGLGDSQRFKQHIDTLFESCLASSPTRAHAQCENGPNDQPCQNGGEAVGVYPQCICECPTNYSGEHCENRDWIQNRSRLSIQGCEVENQPTEVSPETCYDFFLHMHSVAGSSPAYCSGLDCTDSNDASRCCRGAYKEYVDNCDGVEWVQDRLDLGLFQSQEQHDQAIQRMREICEI